MRKTMDVDDDLKARIDKLRKERSMSMKVIVNEVLRLGLREVEEEHKRGTASSSSSHSVE
jgi:predicted transcriptional regulator